MSTPVDKAVESLARSSAALTSIAERLVPARGEKGPRGVPPGALIQYYSDLSSGLLAPEDMRIEDLSFSVIIDPLGGITKQSNAVTLVSRYNFAFRRATGFAMDPTMLGPAAALISFNIREQGRDFTIFKRPVTMASILSGGAGNTAEWDGVYVTVPGTDLAVDWTIDSQRWPGLVGRTVEVGVQLLGDYVVCRGNF